MLPFPSKTLFYNILASLTVVSVQTPPSPQTSKIMELRVVRICLIFSVWIPFLAAQLTVRLINGTYNSGRLEVFYNGTWNTVCDDEFGQEEARVVCRMLGFESTGAAFVESNIYGAGEGNILLDDLRCRGTETSLSQCVHRGLYSHNCGHLEDVGVICNTDVELTARLFGGTPWAGRLQIFYKGNWSTVCDDDFGKEEARVACRMLGYDSREAYAVGSAMYGQGNGNILFDNVVCRGTETTLAQCKHNGYNTHNCGNSEDVGVICKVDAGHIRLTGIQRTRNDTGRVEFLLGPTWTTPCIKNFSADTAKVICRQLGLPSKASIMTAGSPFGPRQGGFVNVDLICTGSEPSILGCFQNFTGFKDSCSTDNFGIICSESNSSLFIVTGQNTSNPGYPLLEGTNATLKCENTQRSLSGVVYTWPETAGGRPSGQYLTFSNVSRAQNGGRVRCMATYNGFYFRRQATSDTLDLQVYYRPSISVTWDSCQTADSGPKQCVVVQNQNVVLQCDADSNPRPSSTRWSGRINSTTGRLQIIAADKRKHHGVYTCHVTTGTVSGEIRQPLSTSYTFAVIVKYAPRVVRFHMNAERSQFVTVEEHSKVNMQCEAEGMPTPYMKIFSHVDSSQRVLASRPQGKIQLSEEKGYLGFSLTDTSCEASGNYTCEVDNDSGEDRASIKLLVRCAPRIRNTTELVPVMDMRDNNGYLSLQIIAYPLPHVTSRTFLGPDLKDDIRGVPADNRLQVNCAAKNLAPSSVTCNITIVNMTNDDKGVYKIIFSNSLGDLPFRFEVRERERSAFPQSYLFLIIMSLGGGMLVFLIIVTIVQLTRFKGKDKHIKKRYTKPRQDSEVVLSLQDIISSETENAYFEKNVLDTAVNVNPQKTYDTDVLYANTAQLEEEVEGSTHDYINVQDAWKRTGI